MKFLIADDDMLGNSMLNLVLSEFGFCDVVDDPKQLERRLYDAGTELQSYGAVFMSIGFKGENTLEMLKRFSASGKKIYDGLKFVLMSENDEIISLMSLYSTKKYRFLKKPADKIDVVNSLKYLNVV